MLYDRWQQVVREHGGELALVEQATRRRWTFSQLDDDGVTEETTEASAVVYPTGAGAEFIRRTIAGWRHNRVLCPVEAGATPPMLASVPAGIAHLKLTSATGGQARLVSFTAEQLAADAAQIVSTMGLRADWPNLSAISLAHSYGFSSLVLPLLLHGIPLVLLDAQLPESVRLAVREFGPVTLPAVPALWRAWHEAGVLSSQIQLAISAGAALSLGLECAVHDATGLKLHNFYGSTECGGIAYDRESTPRSDEACAGAAMDQVTLTVGDTGCLDVRSPAVGSGYWPEPEAALADACFRTSDLAEVRDGLVYLRGRAGDLINVAGRKVTPNIIEEALRENDDVADCLVFGVPGADAGRGDLIVACVVPKARGDEGLLRRFLLARLPAWQVPKEWRFIDRLPTNERGKLSRAQWRARLGYPRTLDQ